MGVRFDPAEIAFMGISAPVRTEASIEALEVYGEVPAELNGAFYRVGPDPAYPPTYKGYTPIVDGDGMMSMFRFREGRVDFRSRYVNTERHQLERAANHALFGRYRNPYTDDPSVAGRNRGQANTTMRMHAGILWALKEDSPGIAIEPVTLGTLGVHDFNGAVTSATMTAHPKVDAVTGEMVFYGSAAKGETTPDIAFYVAGSDGKITKEEWLVAPYASMIHDFAVTRKWVVFPVMPTVSNLERIKAGGPLYDWEPERGMYLGLLPRNGTAADIRWVHSEARWFYHAMNAYDDGDLVHIDVAESRVQPFAFLHLDRSATWSPEQATPKFTRWTVDTRTGTLATRQLLDLPAEFPRIDERRELTGYRHGYLLVDDPARPPRGLPWDRAYLNSVGHYDHDRASLTLAYAGDDAIFEEPQFVPRSAGAPEGDGFLLAVRHHHDTRLTDLVILDTADLSAAPLAVARLPFRIRPATHGNWVQE